MKTQDAIRLSGSRRDLSRLLGVSVQATYAWGERIPDKRLWQLRNIRPDWFRGTEDDPVLVARLAQEERVDRILQLADALRQEALAWRNS